VPCPVLTLTGFSTLLRRVLDIRNFGVMAKGQSDSFYTPSNRPRTLYSVVSKSMITLFIAYVGYCNIIYFDLPLRHYWNALRGSDHAICRPPLPAHMTVVPPPQDNTFIRRASHRLDARLKDLHSREDVDSVTVAVVTANGPIFSKGYGVLCGNETEKRGPVNEDTIYRIASISKLFTVLELWILKEKGAIAWYVTYLNPC
jgi:hypothetical protein